MNLTKSEVWALWIGSVIAQLIFGWLKGWEDAAVHQMMIAIYFQFTFILTMMVLDWRNSPK